MTPPPLTRDIIKQPARWRLALSFSDTSLNVLATCSVGDEEPLLSTIPLQNSGATSPAAALEEAVYANPLLLGNFNRTDIVAVTSRFHILPPEAASNSDVLDALDIMFDSDHPTPEVAPLDARNSIVAMLDRDTARFLHRTFDRASLQGHLAVIGRYLSRRSRLGNSGKLYVNLAADSRIDIFAFDSAGLSGANTFNCQADADAVYYILAIARTCNMDLANDEIFIAGDALRRGAIVPQLTPWASNVFPLILPPTLAGSCCGAPLELSVIV